MSRSIAVRNIGAALVIGCIVGILTAMALWLGVGLSFRADVSDAVLPSADAGPVYVVEIDADFAEASQANPFVYSELTQVLTGVGARTVYVEPDVLDAANPGLDAQEFETIAADLLGRAEGVIVGRGDVVLAPPAVGSNVPVLAASRSSQVIEDAGDFVGFDNVVADSEVPVVRTVPLLAEELPDDSGEATLVPAVSLIPLIEHAGLSSTLEETAGGLELGGEFVPTEDQQRLRVAFAPALLPGGDHLISASDVLAGGADVGALEGATVVLGLTDPSTARSLSTPTGPGGRLSAALIQANAINTLLTGQYLQPAGTALVAVTAGVAAFVVAAGVLLLPLWSAPFTTAAVAALWYWLAGLAASRGMLSDVLAGFVAIGAAMIAALVWRAVREIARRRRVTALFSQYVPATVARQLVDESTLAEVQSGQRLEVAVLFCDLRGFTPMCAKLEPAQVREILDLYYARTTEVILAGEGTVMQFVGDEVFAVFGAPLAQQDCAERAVRCATDLIGLQERLGGELEERGLPAVTYGIGVHSGVVVAAHPGSPTRRQYAVIGDPVNVGSRLCSQAKSGEAVVSAQVMDAVADPPPATPLGGITLKGVDEPVACFLLDQRTVADTTRAEKTTTTEQEYVDRI